MIFITHNNYKVLRVFSEKHQEEFSFTKSKSIIGVLYELAEQNPEALLVWQHESLVEQLDLNYITKISSLGRKMLSFSSNFFLPSQIGYLEQSPFIAVNKKVTYPTWQMSAQVGCIAAKNLVCFQNIVNDANFCYALCSIAKLGMPRGLWCYSDPHLVQSNIVVSEIPLSIKTLFKFIKQHYKSVWVGLLFFNLLIYEKRWSLLSVIRTFGVKRRTSEFNVKEVITKPKIHKSLPSIDVVIPTIGRPKYLYKVLKNLAKQTLLPKKVIVVEQNPDTRAKTQLPFIIEENWPFKIIHYFIHQTGACNARNLALKSVTSEYVYMADDDIVFDYNLINKALSFSKNNDIAALAMSCLQQGQQDKINTAIQWPTFGGGCSIVKSEYLKTVAFDEILEHGYGEDVDFGMQLREIGADIIYHPDLKTLHLKAPVGGFRTEFIQPWAQEDVQPKPAPTILYSLMKHYSKEQILGYKTLLFFKFYLKQPIKNPIKYFKVFKLRWAKSVYWMNILKNT